MSSERGYLQTITCNISLSSCRLRAESLARAFNDKLWSARRLNASNHRTGKACDTYLTLNSDNKVITSTNTMASVIDQPSGTPMESFEVNVDKQMVVNNGWINDMSIEDGEDMFDTPPCSSPPSPADDHENIIVNPPTLNVDYLPFSAKFMRNIKSDDAVTNRLKLSEKLQQYADGLFSAADDPPDTFYDASEDNQLHNYQEKPQTSNSQNSKSNLTKVVTDSLSTEKEIVQKCTSIPQNHCDSDISTSISNGEINSTPKISICVHPETPIEKSASVDSKFSSSNSENEPENIRLKVNNPHLVKIKELDDDERPKLIRTTSLKTGKTPPGTPSRKKIVRFADVLGLDLEAVRHIVSGDLPNVPLSAFNDLKLPPEDVSSNTSISTQPQQQLYGTGAWNTSPHVVSGSPLTGLFPLFDVPSSDPCFINRVREEWVSLERLTVSDLNVHCVCCVLNLSFEKTVTARYTTDEWRSFNEVVAAYVPFSSDGDFDRFSFSLFLRPSEKHANQRLCFAIRYTTKGTERWDNNRGQNYVLRFQGADDSAASLLLPRLEGGLSWLDHFY